MRVRFGGTFPKSSGRLCRSYEYRQPAYSFSREFGGAGRAKNPPGQGFCPGTIAAACKQVRCTVRIYAKRPVGKEE